MSQVWTIFKREFKGYFATPLAYVFIVIFLMLTGVFTFELAGFYERGMANLSPFFGYHPILYLVLVPAVSMRLWAEERKTGTIELLMTLPVSMTQAVLGKFLAAWAFTGVALLFTFPLWITVNYLGNPDNGVIAASYLGSFLMAGAYLAIGGFISAATKNQIIAFILTAVVCFLFVLAGMPFINGAFSGLPEVVRDTVQEFSFLTRFESLTKGVIALRDLLFFLSLITVFLFANAIVVEWKKAD